MKLKIKDKVMVITGKDKGKTSVITKVFPKDNTVVVKDINLYKRHVKRQSEQQPGGIIEIERPINVSKIMLVSPHTNKVTRIGITRSKTGEAIRICKSSGQPIDTK